MKTEKTELRDTDTSPIHPYSRALGRPRDAKCKVRGVARLAPGIDVGAQLYPLCPS